MIKITKKKKLYLVFAVVITVIVALLLVCSLFYRPKSFEWEGMVFNLPDNFKYRFSKIGNSQKIHIYPVNTADESPPKLVIGRLNLNKINIEDILSKLNNDKQFDLINHGSEILDGEDIFVVDVKYKVTGEKQKLMYVFKKNILMILSHKNRERFKEFDPVLESIRFIDDEKADRK